MVDRSGKMERMSLGTKRTKCVLGQVMMMMMMMMGIINIRAGWWDLVTNIMTRDEIGIEDCVGFGSADLADIEGMHHLHKVGLVRGSRFGRVEWD